MAKRDSLLTLRKKEIDRLTEEIDSLTDEVLELTGFRTVHSLNATYGGKHAEYIDIKHAVIDTPEQFVTLYLQGFLRTLEELGPYARSGNRYFDAYHQVKEHRKVREWLVLFLKRTFLRNYEALSRVRPTDEEASIWIGQKNASYGLFVTPRFKHGQWENDKSEIRHFRPRYWTIGHVLATGFVVPGEKDRITFKNVDKYLSFFQNTLVRNSGSKHELPLAKRYYNFARELI